MKKISILIPGVILLMIILTQCISLGGSTRMITIDSPTPVDEYQVMITLGRHNFNYKAAQSDGSDVRIVDAEGNMLPFWIETWNPYGISTIWVRVPSAGTDTFTITTHNGEDIPGSDGTKVFDPVSRDMVKDGWLYSGILPGMVSGWEYPLTEFDYDTENWKSVAIDTDFVDECEHSRWFVRKEIFIAQGEIVFSGQADDDFVWTLIGSDELYKKIAGDESDSDGLNAGDFVGSIITEEPFGHYIWAGRGQEGKDQEFLSIISIDSGIEFLYTRKSVGGAFLKDERGTEDDEIIEPDVDIEEKPGDPGTEDAIVDEDDRPEDSPDTEEPVDE